MARTPEYPRLEKFLPLLRCPRSGTPLLLAVADGAIWSMDRVHHYDISPGGIPLLAGTPSVAAEIQQEHYDRISGVYVDNLAYPHTREYMVYLDDELRQLTAQRSLGSVAEICCGAGEVSKLFPGHYSQLVGVDISLNMLLVAQARADDRTLYVQGDATNLPLSSASFDTVMMIGGIHHVGAREQLFSEVWRILKPGGVFYFREPLNDFWLWRVLRAVIYRYSPYLDHETERPLTRKETVPPLEALGFRVEAWKSAGFVGFCLFMNSDVLVFNRAFRWLPGIRSTTRAAARCDAAVLTLPGLREAGLIVVGRARKP